MKKAAPLSNFVDRKQSRDVDDCPSSCHRMSKFCTYAFMSSEVLRLFSELDPRGRVDLLGYFPVIFMELTSVFAPKLRMVFHRLLRAVLFPS